MERLIERVCGLDVHKQTVAACVRVPGSKGTREQHVQTFGTTAAELLALRDWLERNSSRFPVWRVTGFAVHRGPTYRRCHDGRSAPTASRRSSPTRSR
jgi:transposase